MEQKPFFGNTQPSLRFNVPANARTSISGTVLSQPLVQSSSQQQFSNVVVNQAPRPSLSGSLSSPPPQPVLKAPTPGMPSSVGSSSYPTALTPSQSIVTPVSVKSEYNQVLGTEQMQMLLSDIKVEPKAEATGCNTMEEDSKSDINSVRSVQLTDQSVDDVDDCSVNSTNSLLGSALEVKPECGTGAQLNQVKPVAKKGM